MLHIYMDINIKFGEAAKKGVRRKRELCSSCNSFHGCFGCFNENHEVDVCLVGGWSCSFVAHLCHLTIDLTPLPIYFFFRGGEAK